MIANKIGAFTGASGRAVEKIAAIVEAELHAALFQIRKTLN
jgi:hypothetical protein